jgi:hypothetical protein
MHVNDIRHVVLPYGLSYLSGIQPALAASEVFVSFVVQSFKRVNVCGSRCEFEPLESELPRFAEAVEGLTDKTHISINRFRQTICHLPIKYLIDQIVRPALTKSDWRVPEQPFLPRWVFHRATRSVARFG